MDVRDATEMAVVSDARRCAWREIGWLVLHVGLTALVVLFALHGLWGMAPALLWFAVGAVAADTANMIPAVWRSWAEVRRLNRCAGCRVMAAAVDRAWESYRRCDALHKRVGR